MEISLPAKAEDVLVPEIKDPHGLRVKSDLRILETIAPPI